MNKRKGGRRERRKGRERKKEKEILSSRVNKFTLAN